MYSRQFGSAPSDNINLPPNYSGNAFRQRRPSVHVTRERQEAKHEVRPQHTYERYAPIEPRAFSLPEAPERIEYEADYKADYKADEVKDKTDGQTRDTSSDSIAEAAPASLLSPIGNIGTEELLLIALALIVYQGGKDPELALILLALLFV